MQRTFNIFYYGLDRQDSLKQLAPASPEDRLIFCK